MRSEAIGLAAVALGARPWLALYCGIGRARDTIQGRYPDRRLLQKRRLRLRFIPGRNADVFA